MDQIKDDIRIGVFVCHCGSNIGGIIDCTKLTEYARTLPNVIYAEDNMYTCSEVGLKQIKENIKELQLNRVVVASCTPRTHEPLFRETIREVGLNPYLFEMVNIRDQCTWVHMNDSENALEKAKDLIRMGVGKAALLRPLENNRVNVTPIAAVIGGGIAGMTAAASLADQGFKVHLIERTEKLGGNLNNLFKISPTNILASDLLSEKISYLENHSNVEVHIQTTVNGVAGFVGNYDIKLIEQNAIKAIKAGTIIIATGAEVLEAQKIKDYSGNRVINQIDLELNLKNGTLDASNLVMIQCAGARNQDRPYCSSICCTTALKNAILLKEANPETNITILYRDIQTLGSRYEAQYQKARELGVLFLKFNPKNPPMIKEKYVQVYNELIGQEVQIPRDLVVLSTPLIAPTDSKILAQFVKVPQDDQGFFLEAHVKLRPVDFATDGVYVCGSAKWPSDIQESISQGYAAASRASTILSHQSIEVEGATAALPEANKNLCKGCEICIKVCPFGAIKKNEKEEIEIIQILCKGCGTCAATCPHKALTIYAFTNEQILSQIQALGGNIEI